MQVGLSENIKKSSEVGIELRSISRSKVLASDFLYSCSSVATRKIFGRNGYGISK